MAGNRIITILVSALIIAVKAGLPVGILRRVLPGILLLAGILILPRISIGGLLLVRISIGTLRLPLGLSGFLRSLRAVRLPAIWISI